MKHKVKVVVLPTENNLEYPFIVKNMEMGSSNNILLITSNSNNSLDYDEQHLYATVSQDVKPIKKGDYTIFRNKVIKLTADDIHPSMIERCKGKIIATTDKSLGSIITKKDGLLSKLQQEGKIKSFLPQLQQSFLKEFVANPDGEWEVEYDLLLGDEEDENQNLIPKNYLKLNQDNTVNIISVEEKERGITITNAEKKMYSEEEVEHILIKFLKADKAWKDPKKWIKDNL